MNDINCIILNHEWEDKYEKFVYDHDASMLYHSLKYRDLLIQLLDVEALYIIAIIQDEIVGVLPMMIKNGKYGDVVNSLPFYGSNGGFLTKNDKAFQALINYYNHKVIGKETIAASTVISIPLLSNQDFSGVKSNLIDFRIGQFTDIGFESNFEENLMNLFHYKTRNMVRKSMKSGLVISVDNSKLDFLYQVHLENMEAIGGKPKNEQFFKIFPSIYEANKDYKIYTASFDGELISCLLLFYHKNTVEYYTPVIKSDHRDKQPMSLLILQAMKDASEQGYKLWNWGGTWETQEGVYRFKKRWGTFDEKYYYHTQINNKDIFQSTPEELLSEYTDFFVLPFNQLNINKDGEE
ncbi:GNAT family N-acetyltransferase [Roseivirga sp.]|uniref:GNAT family N-acetyltransferase n=1 Tax=Roseivirga sp. TaxID=1964215 RepID=UPI002B2768E7|nr:GNAT family N-acetyltransferase [Roseivirga sp.]